MVFFKICIELVEPKQKFEINPSTIEEFTEAILKYGQRAGWDKHKTNHTLRELNTIAILYKMNFKSENNSKRITAYVQAKNQMQAHLIFMCTFDKYELGDCRKNKKIEYIINCKHYQDIFS